MDQKVTDRIGHMSWAEVTLDRARNGKENMESVQVGILSALVAIGLSLELLVDRIEDIERRMPD